MTLYRFEKVVQGVYFGCDVVASGWLEAARLGEVKYRASLQYVQGQGKVRLSQIGRKNARRV